LSQLDLGLSADVSARHISFLETGRSRPSVEMVGLLAETLDVPLRDRNEMLRSAGFSAAFPELTAIDALAGPLGVAVDAMLRHSEPYPMMVMDRLYRVSRANDAAQQILGLAGIDLGDPVTDVLGAVFQESYQELLGNWNEFAGAILRRVQREVLHRPQDRELNALLNRLLSSEVVPDEWRQPSLDAAELPMIPLVVTVGDAQLRFLTTITAFNAPSNVALDELRIETYYPLDEVTDRFCHDVARE